MLILRISHGENEVENEGGEVHASRDNHGQIFIFISVVLVRRPRWFKFTCGSHHILADLHETRTRSDVLVRRQIYILGMERRRLENARPTIKCAPPSIDMEF